MPPAPERALTLLTDYGVGSEYVGALHLALARACPAADRIDIAHDIPPGDILWGALTLSRHAPSLPGAVHLAVVDPGVGGQRRPLAVALADDGFVVGPDNGLLGPLVDAVGARGAVELAAPPDGSPCTFHGRDLFAPAAARLSAGGDLADLGSKVDAAGIARPDLTPPEVAPGVLVAEAVGRDHFGNISLLATWADLADAELGIAALTIRGPRGPGVRAAAGSRFGDVRPGEFVVYADANRVLSVAKRGGDAWEMLGCEAGSPLTITTRGS